MGNNPETDTIASVRYHCMNVQAQARIGRETEELFRMEDEPLSPGQQIRLHLRCLLQEHKFGKLAWHLSGIRRAIFPAIPPKDITDYRSSRFRLHPVCR
jgi:hypothetical protein